MVSCRLPRVAYSSWRFFTLLVYWSWRFYPRSLQLQTTAGSRRGERQRRLARLTEWLGNCALTETLSRRDEVGQLEFGDTQPGRIRVNSKLAISENKNPVGQITIGGFAQIPVGVDIPRARGSRGKCRGLCKSTVLKGAGRQIYEASLPASSFSSRSAHSTSGAWRSSVRKKCPQLRHCRLRMTTFRSGRALVSSILSSRLSQAGQRMNNPNLNRHIGCDTVSTDMSVNITL